MNDASIALDRGESIKIHDYDLGLFVLVWLKEDGSLSVSINRCEDRDMLQIETRERLVSLKSWTGENLRKLVVDEETK
jgi:hypothetical protein